MRYLLLIGMLLYCIIANADISNLIVFGDSLSDIGNFPASTQIWKNPKAKKTVANTVAQLYVPFSNPVYKKINNPYLPKRIPIDPNTQPRQYRSVGWAQYFLSLRNTIAPSSALEDHPTLKNNSIVFAWGFATSDHYCVNPYYHPIKNCDENSILLARTQYQHNPTKLNYKKIEIPGLFEQEKLFFNALQSKKITVTQNTQYVFWIGGNDLIAANNALMDHGDPLPALKFLFGETASHEIKTAWYLIHHLPPHAQPQKIYCFSLFNPGLTPMYYDTILGKVANIAVHCANFWLRIESTLFNLFSKTQLVVVPVNQWFQTASHSSLFQATLGKTCQLNGRYPGDSISKKEGESECGNFMFWNVVHPSTAMNKIIASHFLTH